MGKQFAKLGHQMMRIAVIDIRETRPERSREFQAEEAAAKFQHAVRLFKRLLDMGDVPYAKGDCISVEQIGSAPVRTPVTNAHLDCRLLLEHKKQTDKRNTKANQHKHHTQN